MPLLNSIIQQLNEITTNVKNKNELSVDDELMIKKIFNDINKRNESYDVNEIEAWFENEGSWTNKDVRVCLFQIVHHCGYFFRNHQPFYLQIVHHFFQFYLVYDSGSNHYNRLVCRFLAQMVFHIHCHSLHMLLCAFL